MKSVLILSLLSLSLLTGCAGGEPAQRVSTGGSTSMHKLMSMLQEDFMAAREGISVSYDPTGSGAGIEGAASGTLDIGLSSRNLRETETDVRSIPVCLDGIALVVHPENPVKDLSLSELAGIFTGEITDWAEVGGKSGEIVPIGREAGSGSREGFETVLGVRDQTRYRQELTATGAISAAVAANPLAIGYASLAAVRDNVSVLTVDGIPCTVETIQNGTYRVQRPFHFIVAQDAELSPATAQFIEYVTDGSADRWIQLAGCIPLQRTEGGKNA